MKNDSIAGYSPYIQNVCTVFMLLCGVNFSCYYLLLLRQVKSVFRDEELRLAHIGARALGPQQVHGEAVAPGGGDGCGCTWGRCWGAYC